MSPLTSLLVLLWSAVGSHASDAAGAAGRQLPGPFFEPEYPFFQSIVSIPRSAEGREPPDIVVRGILIPLGARSCLLFDQELLRVAAVWEVPTGAPPVTLRTMAQASYADPFAKATFALPQPAGPLQLSTPASPGLAARTADLRQDPRPRNARDAGRGPLPAATARFEGIDLHDTGAVLHYRVDGTGIREWHEEGGMADAFQLIRHFEVAARDGALAIALGSAAAPDVRFVTNLPDLQLTSDEQGWVAVLPPGAAVRRFSIGLPRPDSASHPPLLSPTSPPPRGGARRWPDFVTTRILPEYRRGGGLILDHLELPEVNPWRRRVRPADLAFMNSDEAAVLTYDGDVWWVDGIAAVGQPRLRWRRYASGLHEPMAIAAVGAALQVATKNGVVRLYDTDGNGEVDRIENFNDQVRQSQSTRAYALDMAMTPDGSTYLTQGAIPAAGTEHAGAIMKISPNGDRLEVIASGTREAFVAVNPRTGLATATDQQGNYIPTSPVYVVRPGDHFGFRVDHPQRLTPPLAWIPHEQDSSSASQLWVWGPSMGPLDGRLLHLSYGTGRMFLVSADLEAPVAQGAIIPLPLETELPLLHARMDPDGTAVYLAGFQVFGSRVASLAGLARLRLGPDGPRFPLAARSVAGGVLLEFARPIARDSLEYPAFRARGWNYQRSAAYGSGRYALDGLPGTTPLSVTQVSLARDRRSLWVQIDPLPSMSQLELAYRAAFDDGAPIQGEVFFTIHQARPPDLDPAAFSPLERRPPASTLFTTDAEPTASLGRHVAEQFGCLACHSTDGSTAGKTGPSWRGLYGKQRTLHNGTAVVADTEYIIDRIMDPQRRRLRADPVEMPSYAGVLSSAQLQAITLYIASLRAAE